MKISTKGRYGLRALVDIAANGENGPVPLAQVAGRQKISLNYLEQVFGILRKADLVVSVKGASGGYRLARDMDDITVKEVLEALEGRFSITDFLDSSPEDPVQKALKELLWDVIDKRVNEFLEARTLGQLVREYQRKKEAGTVMYYI